MSGREKMMDSCESLSLLPIVDHISHKNCVHKKTFTLYMADVLDAYYSQKANYTCAV